VLYTVLVMLAAASAASAASSSVPSYTIQTVAGSTSGAASSTTLGQPEGVLLDFQGDIYFSDALQNVVRKIDTSGKVTTIAGTGTGGFSGDGGPALSAQLNQPYGLAADSNGNLYIADLGNARVRIVTPNGNIATFAGGGSLPAATAAYGAASTAVSLAAPRNIAVGSDGTVYFSDFNAHQIYSVYEGVLTVFAGTGEAGSTGDLGPATAASLDYPAGLAMGFEGELYVADSANNEIREIANGIISTVASVKRPTGVAVDFNETLYVAAANMVGPVASASLLSNAGANDIAVDLVGNMAFVTPTAVYRADLTGKLITVLGGSGTQAATTATPSVLTLPAGLALDATGNVYIADQKANLIWKLSSAGAMTVIFGNSSATTLSSPSSVAVDASGNLYIADTGNNRVLEVAADGTSQTVGGQLSSPSYVFADAAGLLIADTGNNRIVAVDTSGNVSVAETVDGPTAAIRDASGDIYVSEGAAGQVVIFQANGWAAPLLVDAKAPAGLALDSSGNLIVADSGHNTVRLVAPGGSFTTIAGTGVAGDAGDSGPATAALLNAPMDVKVDGKGQIYVADSLNGAIRILVPSTPESTVPITTVQTGPFTVVSSASLLAGPVTGGEIVAILGSGFDPKNTQVTFDGTPAFLFYTSAGQVNALVPNAVSNETATSVAVISDGQTVGTVSVPAAATAPGIFTIGSGTGQAAALNHDLSLNSAANPATPGSTIVLYATGDGVGNVSVSIAGQTANILYAGEAPGYIGLMQVNAQIPTATASGAAAVVLTIGAASSQSGVTITVQ